MTWLESNQRYLAAVFAAMREHLDRHQRGTTPTGPSTAVRDELSRAREEMPEGADAAINTLAAVFGLTPFERDALVLLAGAELDADIAALCAAIAGSHTPARPTFSLLFAALPDAHWSAISPSGALRYWKMVETTPGESPVLSPLRVDERIVHHLLGVDFLDERLDGYIEPVELSTSPAASQQAVADQLAASWADPTIDDLVTQLGGADRRALRDVAATAAGLLGTRLWQIADRDIPETVHERTLLVRLWEREAALSGRALLVTHDEFPARAVAVAERIRGAVVLAGREPLELRDRVSSHLEVRHPTPAEQRQLWIDAIPGGVASDDHIAAVVRQFDLGVDDLRKAGHDYVDGLAREAPTTLWSCARAQSRPRGPGLGERVESTATWDDLVLPEHQLQVLRNIAAQVRRRSTVYDEWGFGERGSRGLGISALFSGRSGTGKTLAAEVLANELELDLYRIDLSLVISKYIGDTEKNLRKVFDAAEMGGSILLFDEADALFGKRSEVKDSHDRFANIEISYLLQRMETYRGLAILTTNLRDAIDQAFLRRIRFIVDFRFPTTELRERMWEGAFPAALPTGELRPDLLAQLSVAGGNIRNIAMNAAFHAADEDAELSMAHLGRAARDEFAKLDQTVPDAALRGWA